MPRKSLLLTALLATAGCAPVGPDFTRPATAVSNQWSDYVREDFQFEPQDSAAWWNVLNDPVINDLVVLSHQQNNNLKIAGLRVLESRAALGIATGNQYPQAQFISGDATALELSESNANTAGAADLSYQQYNVGVGASWEIDFWGRYANGIAAADAGFLASIAAYQQAQVLLNAAVVSTYVAVRSLEEQLRIAYENTKLQQRSYDIAQVLFDNGADSELDMQQAKTLLLSTQASIPAIESSLKQARNALSLLLGLNPGSVTSRLATGEGIPEIPADTSIGLPADTLRRRPDVRQAELTAMAANALVGVAEADLYPSFSLTGSIGVAAGGPGDSDFGDLFDSDAITWSIGPSFVWPFLNYGRIKNNVRVQDARLQQALINYRETTLQASREVEDAMAEFIGARAQHDILEQTVESAKRSNELSTLRYKEGFSDYERVLNAQQALFSQQQRYVSNQGETVLALVNLYKSLGGGWEQNITPTSTIDPETLEIMDNRTDWGDMLDVENAQNTAPEGQGN